MNIKLKQQESNKNKKIFCLIFIVVFTVFTTTASGHRFTPDEYFSFVQAQNILNQTPDPNFIEGETTTGVVGGVLLAEGRPICKNAILCSPTPILSAISYIPFIFIEQTFHILPEIIYTDDDFDDPGYVFWRNSLPNEETFVFLFYGPLFSALSVSIFF